MYPTLVPVLVLVLVPGGGRVNRENTSFLGICQQRRTDGNMLLPLNCIAAVKAVAKGDMGGPVDI